MANDNSNYYDGQICDVQPIESRFNTPNAFELLFEVGLFDENKNPLKKVNVFLELSMRYGTGNNASKTQKDMTFETLHSLGFEGEDLSSPRLKTLVNRPCRVREQTQDKNGQPLQSYRYYFTTAKPIVLVADANAKLREIMSGVAAPAPAGATPPPNPFAAPAPAAPAAAPANPFAAPAAAPAGATPPPNPFAGM